MEVSACRLPLRDRHGFAVFVRDTGPGIPAELHVFLERYVDQSAVDAHPTSDHFKALGRKMGEFMDGRPEVVRLRQVE